MPHIFAISSMDSHRSRSRGCVRRAGTIEPIMAGIGALCV
jgi:hypothetical protein